MSYPKCGLTFNQFQEANAERCSTAFHRIGEWDQEKWLLAVFGELGEAANLMKKRLRLRTSGAQGNTDDEMKNWTDEQWEDAIAEEVADAITYLDLLLTEMGRNTGDEITKKFNKVNRRIAYMYEENEQTAGMHTLYRDLANPDD